MSSSDCNKFKKDPRFLHVKEAFAKDGFTEIQGCIEINGNLGIRAANPKAVNYCTGEPKLAYYMEGSYYDMGYQMGYLAEEDVSEMTTVYVADLLGDFIFPHLCKPLKIAIGKILDKIILPGVKKLAASKAIPEMYNDQIKGILAGCKKANPKTKANLDGLQILNFGQDVICAHLFTGDIFHGDKDLEKVIEELKMPGGRDEFIKGLGESVKKLFRQECNAFSLKNGKPGDKDYYHYFGRDCMLVCGDVFQNTACMFIYNPDHVYKGKKALPSTAQAAPGMVFDIAGMNINAVAMGVNMLPAAASNPGNPGLNTNLLCRHCLDYGENADSLVGLIKNAQRGVSALYPFADGSTGKAGVVEALMSLNIKSDEELARYLREFPLKEPTSELFKLLMGDFIKHLGDHLPTTDFIRNHLQQSKNLKKGFLVRWSDYKYPGDYQDYNQGLWDYYNKIFGFLGEKVLHPGALGPVGFINLQKKKSKKFKIERNCPSTYYFPPQRENNPGLFLCSNSSVSPEVHFASMSAWLAVLLEITGHTSNQDDFQWRYDTMNKMIRDAQKKGPVTVDEAIGLIDFLNPLTGKFPKYYADQPTCKGEPQIHGSVSLFDLKEKTAYSHFGYYCDKWVRITLPNYIR